MNYQIIGLCPRGNLGLGGWGFCIKLYPGFKVAVSESGIDQEKVNTAVENMGRVWLDGCKFDRMLEYDDKKEPIFKPNRDLYVSWGEWGPEHITAPGNACGLDIDIDEGLLSPRNGKILTPHNIDRMQQAMLLLIVFTWFAEAIHGFAESPNKMLESTTNGRGSV